MAKYRSSLAPGRIEAFDYAVFAGHSDQTLAILADASNDERAILSAVRFRPNRVVLHRDPALMPKRRAAWSAWNYLRSSRPGGEPEITMTYWMNRLQGIDETKPLFVSLNPEREPKAGTVFGEWTYEHPQFDAGGARGAEEACRLFKADGTAISPARGRAMVFMKMGCAPALKRQPRLAHPCRGTRGPGCGRPRNDRGMALNRAV